MFCQSTSRVWWRGHGHQQSKATAAHLQHCHHYELTSAKSERLLSDAQQEFQRNLWKAESKKRKYFFIYRPDGSQLHPKISAKDTHRQYGRPDQDRYLSSKTNNAWQTSFLIHSGWSCKMEIKPQYCHSQASRRKQGIKDDI